MQSSLTTWLLLPLLVLSVSTHAGYVTPPPPQYPPIPSPVTIDNGLAAEPEVVCETSSISLHFKTKQGFAGKVFVKGHVADSSCITVGDGQKQSHRFEVRHDSCGVRRQREIGGVVISATVIISFHSIFITKVDRAYRVSCFYVEGTKKVHQHLDIAALTTQLLESQTNLPVCKYEILSDPSTNGAPIKYAKIGDTVYHKWTCIPEMENMYCMRVHSCTVYDGQGGPPVTVIDTNGCSTDGVILQNLEYGQDLVAGRSSPVFKFADKAGLYFNCQIQLTIKDVDYGCSTTQPQCYPPPPQYAVQPAYKTTEYVAPAEHESGYPTKSAYPAPTSQPPIHYPSSPAPPPATGAAYPEPPMIPDNAYDVAQYNETDQPFTTSSAYTEGDGAYSRLIKRNVKEPVTVADLDLPERGILVFGLEENPEGETGDAGAGSFPLIARNSTCFSNSRLVFSFLFLVFAFLTTIVVFIVIVNKQRQLLAQSAFFAKN